MNLSPEAMQLIKDSEGLRLSAYLDPVSVPTIGYGHTAGVKLGQTITQEQANAFLQADLKDAIAAVATSVQVQLTPAQAGALVSFAFNVGAGALATSTLLDKVNAKDWTGAAQEFLRWTHAGGEVLPGLMVRRKAESKIFLEGSPKGLATAPVFGRGVKVNPQYQHSPVSCGQTSVAVAIDALTGKHLADTDIAARYGFALLLALNEECRDAGFVWKDAGNLLPSSWPLIQAKTDAGLPVVTGLNGVFSATGRGHIVLITKIIGETVAYADPAHGEMRSCLRSDMNNCPPHPDGKFMFVATRAAGVN